MEDFGFCGGGLKIKCRITAQHLGLARNSPKVWNFRGVRFEMGDNIYQRLEAIMMRSVYTF